MRSISTKIIVSVLIAFVLIGLSIFINYSSNTNNTPSLVAENQKQTTNTNQTYNTTQTGSTQTNPTIVQNQTDLLSKQLFANYILLQKSGDLNAESTQNLADQLSSQINTNLPSKIYQKSDLTIIKNPTKADLKNYGNQFMFIKDKYTNQYNKDPLGQNNQSIDLLDPKVISQLSNISNLYENMAKELLNLPVPADLIDVHLEIVNNYFGSADGLKKISQIDTDPIVAISGIGIHAKFSSEETSLLKQIAGYLFENGIIFSKDEPGAGWEKI